MHYVIGDVHGCFDELQLLLNKINAEDPDAEFIFVGDFIDRGPKVWETLEWMMANITPDGKYRSVRGNHEQMVLKWYPDFVASCSGDYTVNPRLHYGFDTVAREHDCVQPEDYIEIIEFLYSLPLHIDLRVTSTYGKEVDYVIAHAFAPRLTDSEESAEDLESLYLWSREHYWGFPSDGRILVHGHTTTLSFDYELRGPTRPGMIAYRSNAINVDGGCCFFYHGHGVEAPCFLCAIRLEDLQEFYSHTIEERFHEALLQNPDDTSPRFFEDITQDVDFKIERYWAKINNLHYCKSGDYNKEKILKERLVYASASRPYRLRRPQPRA